MSCSWFCVLGANSLSASSLADTEGLFTFDSGADRGLADLTLDLDTGAFENEFDEHYGLLAPKQTVLIRSYSDDTDDQVLSEIQPKFIIMYEPNEDFIRRIEVRK